MRDLESKRWEVLTRKSTVELARRIVWASDRMAVSVLLETRTLFRLKSDTEPLLLPEFLMRLRDREISKEAVRLTEVSKDSVEQEEIEIADCAYDLTLEKYFNFPNERKTDCRNYYRAFLHIIEMKIAQGALDGQAEEEHVAGNILQSLVLKNFYLSKLECYRIQSHLRRYTWVIEGQRLTLKFPSYMTGTEFREWLEENIRDVVPMRPMDQRSIQAIVDKHLFRPWRISLDDPRVAGKLGSEDKVFPVEHREAARFGKNLAHAVAEEKVANIADLSPAISKLGEENIRDLIFRIFRDLERGEFEASKIARDYGLSKATFHRFASIGWSFRTIPPLWENTAEVLAGSEVFMETVSNFTLTGRLKEILDISKYLP